MDQLLSRIIILVTIYFFQDDALALWNFSSTVLETILEIFFDKEVSIFIADCILGLLIISFFAAPFIAWSARTNQIKKVREIVRKCIDEISAHERALKIRYEQTIFRDAYGSIVKDGWEKEKKYFIDTKLHKFLCEIELERDRLISIEQCCKYIDLVATSGAKGDLQQKVDSSPFQFSDNMDPSDYERYCAEVLKKAGWDARVTRASNDQGCDVVATKNGRKLVVQCKLYSSPVGNSAVQEISASRLHEQADFAVVVSNAAFTKPARQLANTNNVMLLHHDQLPSLEKEIAELSTQTV